MTATHGMPCRKVFERFAVATTGVRCQRACVPSMHMLTGLRAVHACFHVPFACRYNHVNDALEKRNGANNSGMWVQNSSRHGWFSSTTTSSYSSRSVLLTFGAMIVIAGAMLVLPSNWRSKGKGDGNGGAKRGSGVQKERRAFMPLAHTPCQDEQAGTLNIQ